MPQLSSANGAASGTKRIIPTERLDALCEEFRTAVDKTLQTTERVCFAVQRLDIPELEKLRIIAILEEARPNYHLLSRTEEYLRTNKAKIIRNRRRMAELAKDPNYTPAHIPTSASRYLHEEEEDADQFTRFYYDCMNKFGHEPIPALPHDVLLGLPQPPKDSIWVFTPDDKWEMIKTSALTPDQQQILDHRQAELAKDPNSRFSLLPEGAMVWGRRVPSAPTPTPPAPTISQASATHQPPPTLPESTPASAPTTESPYGATITSSDGTTHHFGPAALPEVIPPSQFSIKRRGS